MGLFEINTAPAKAKETAGGFVAAGTQPRMIVAKRKDKLVEIVDALFSGTDDIYFLSEGDWNLFDFFNLVLHRISVPADLYLCTYAIYEFPIRQILLAQEAGQLSSVHMIIDSRARIRNASTLALAQNICNKISLKACHAKVMVLRYGNEYVSLIGSQNWTKNPRIETGMCTRQSIIGQFHIDWMEKVLEGCDAFI